MEGEENPGTGGNSDDDTDPSKPLNEENVEMLINFDSDENTNDTQEHLRSKSNETFLCYMNTSDANDNGEGDLASCLEPDISSFDHIKDVTFFGKINTSDVNDNGEADLAACLEPDTSSSDQIEDVSIKNENDMCTGPPDVCSTISSPESLQNVNGGRCLEEHLDDPSIEKTKDEDIDETDCSNLFCLSQDQENDDLNIKDETYQSPVQNSINILDSNEDINDTNLHLPIDVCLSGISPECPENVIDGEAFEENMHVSSTEITNQVKTECSNSIYISQNQEIDDFSIESEIVQSIVKDDNNFSNFVEDVPDNISHPGQEVIETELLLNSAKDFKHLLDKKEAFSLDSIADDDLDISVNEQRNFETEDLLTEFNENDLSFEDDAKEIKTPKITKDSMLLLTNNYDLLNDSPVITWVDTKEDFSSQCAEVINETSQNIEIDVSHQFNMDDIHLNSFNHCVPIDSMTNIFECKETIKNMCLKKEETHFDLSKMDIPPGSENQIFNQVEALNGSQKFPCPAKYSEQYDPINNDSLSSGISYVKIPERELNDFEYFPPSSTFENLKFSPGTQYIPVFDVDTRFCYQNSYESKNTHRDLHINKNEDENAEITHIESEYDIQSDCLGNLETNHCQKEEEVHNNEILPLINYNQLEEEGKGVEVVVVTVVEEQLVVEETVKAQKAEDKAVEDDNYESKLPVTFDEESNENKDLNILVGNEYQESFINEISQNGIDILEINQDSDHQVDGEDLETDIRSTEDKFSEILNDLVRGTREEKESIDSIEKELEEKLLNNENIEINKDYVCRRGENELLREIDAEESKVSESSHCHNNLQENVVTPIENNGDIIDAETKCSVEIEFPVSYDEETVYEDHGDASSSEEEDYMEDNICDDHIPTEECIQDLSSERHFESNDIFNYDENEEVINLKNNSITEVSEDNIENKESCEKDLEHESEDNANTGDYFDEIEVEKNIDEEEEDEKTEGTDSNIDIDVSNVTVVAKGLIVNDDDALSIVPLGDQLYFGSLDLEASCGVEAHSDDSGVTCVGTEGESFSDTMHCGSGEGDGTQAEYVDAVGGEGPVVVTQTEQSSSSSINKCLSGAGSSCSGACGGSGGGECQARGTTNNPVEGSPDHKCQYRLATAHVNKDSSATATAACPDDTSLEDVCSDVLSYSDTTFTIALRASTLQTLDTLGDDNQTLVDVESQCSSEGGSLISLDDPQLAAADSDAREPEGSLVKGECGDNINGEPECDGDEVSDGVDNYVYGEDCLGSPEPGNTVVWASCVAVREGESESEESDVDGEAEEADCLDEGCIEADSHTDVHHCPPEQTATTPTIACTDITQTPTTDELLLYDTQDPPVITSLLVTEGLSSDPLGECPEEDEDGGGEGTEDLSIASDEAAAVTVCPATPPPLIEATTDPTDPRQ
ncbi:unnamed protein product [Meganyctiphanes norvegica]|uniref:Uncharacterized protein n=1 Tax=Meganyctiphanes norvegica TaxID=48144 RepID=A0AAV2QJL6_MEGNR